MCVKLLLFQCEDWMKNDRRRSRQRSLFRPEILFSSAEATPVDQSTSVNAALSSNTHDAEADPWKKIPLPSIADVSEQQVMDPKTLLACCKCAKEFSHEHDE